LLGECHRVHRWLSAKNAPNFEGTLQLLKAAGWLDEEGLTAGLAAAAEYESA
jgi:hypothetical protein